MRNDTQLLREGEAFAQFNDSLPVIYRLDDLKKRANYWRSVFTYEGVAQHHAIIVSMALELEAKLSDQEQAELEKVAVKEIMPLQHVTAGAIYAWRWQLNIYERKVRELLQRKGLGVGAKTDDDPKKAILK